MADGGASSSRPQAAGDTIRYVALGDSYTIGEGATPPESWPALLTAHLRSAGIPVELVANPAITGRTSADLIERQLPIYEAAHPAFATLLIGVNDWVQSVSEKDFRARVVISIERMQRILPTPVRLVVVTIPDFGVTPQGPRYSGGRDISAGIARFNAILMEEAHRHGAPAADIFPISQRMGDDPKLVAADGLHPSAAAYAQWERVIYPVALRAVRPVSR